MENHANSTDESKKSGLSGGDLLGMRSSLNTPPPGFGLGDVASFHGQNLSARRAAAASAPPTSLFANNLFDSNYTSLPDDFDRFSNRDIADIDSYRMNLLRGKNQDDKPRTMSYNNLAAALGEGLAESMGHSLVDSNNGNGSAPDISQDDLRVNGNEVDNFARQNRHSSRHRRGSAHSSHSQSTHSNTLLNGSNDDNMKKFEEVSSQFSSISIGGSPSAVSNRLNSNHRVTVVEPSPCSTPALALMGGDFNISTAKTSKDPFKFEPGSKALDLSSSSLFKVGRASAPPQLFESHSSPRKDPILTHVQPHVSISQSRTPMSPAIQSNSANLVLKNDTSVHSQQQQSFMEDPSFKDLSNFIWEKDNNDTDYPSRALAIFGLFGLQLSEVKSTCEAFGSILYFRTEFFASRGIILIAYHDLRSANHAVKELQSYLQKMVSMNGSQTAVKVMFCISLTSSSDRDESTLVISNLPMSIRENSVKDLLSSTFGALRSIRTEAPGCYIVEFFDIQDASQALLEMQSTMPWGPSVILTTKLRQDYERQRGKDLFAVMGKWRQETAQHTSNGMNDGGAQFDRPVVDSRQYVATKSPSPSQDGQTHTTESSSTSHIAYQQQPNAQLVVGPDGQYTYIIMQQQQPPPQYAIPQMQQGHIQTGAPHAYVPNSFDGQQNFDGHGYWVQQAHPAVQQVQHHHGVAYVPRGHVHGVMPHQPVVDPTRHHNLPQHVPGYIPAMASHVTMGAPQMNGGKSPTRRGSQEQNQDSNDLYLSIEAVKSGQDHRTSLMVRNIPNKYTQSMLLSEFKESGHGPGKIDFFYLPIDFRNKCNRGYAFINFVDTRDIVSFYECYNGKSWKVFKSEKICCITYARIQGKEKMMKRFQNSALMEKDQAYRPLVFSPSGDVVHEEVS